MLLVLSLLVILLRAYVRLILEGSLPKIPDYLTAAGWLVTLGWVICVAISFQLGELDGDPTETTVDLLKVRIPVRTAKLDEPFSAMTFGAAKSS